MWRSNPRGFDQRVENKFGRPHATPRAQRNEARDEPSHRAVRQTRKKMGLSAHFVFAAGFDGSPHRDIGKVIAVLP
jgi:hypothetical protein